MRIKFNVFKSCKRVLLDLIENPVRLSGIPFRCLVSHEIPQIQVETFNCIPLKFITLLVIPIGIPLMECLCQMLLSYEFALNQLMNHLRRFTLSDSPEAYRSTSIVTRFSGAILNKKIARRLLNVHSGFHRKANQSQVHD